MKCKNSNYMIYHASHHSMAVNVTQHSFTSTDKEMCTDGMYKAYFYSFLYASDLLII